MARPHDVADGMTTERILEQNATTDSPVTVVVPPRLANDERHKTPSYWVDRGRLWMRCPNGHVARLDDHDVDENGHVDPSVMCPECDFHEYVKLERYREVA